MKKEINLKSGFTSCVFTTEFESAIVIAKVEKVEDEYEKIKAIRTVC